MTRQEHATQMLSRFQEQRSADIGNMTFGIRDNARDLIDIWMEHANRRGEFGEREIKDIAEAVLGLSTLLREIKKQDAA